MDRAIRMRLVVHAGGGVLLRVGVGCEGLRVWTGLVLLLRDWDRRNRNRRMWV